MWWFTIIRCNGTDELQRDESACKPCSCTRGRPISNTNTHARGCNLSHSHLDRRMPISVSPAMCLQRGPPGCPSDPASLQNVRYGCIAQHGSALPPGAVAHACLLPNPTHRIFLSRLGLVWRVAQRSRSRGPCSLGSIKLMPTRGLHEVCNFSIAVSCWSFVRFGRSWRLSRSHKTSRLSKLSSVSLAGSDRR